MKITIALKDVIYAVSVPAEKRRRARSGSPDTATVAKKTVASPVGVVGLEAEALANEKLVLAGHRADVAVTGRGAMLQLRGLGMRGTQPSVLTERITTYLSR